MKPMFWTLDDERRPVECADVVTWGKMMKDRSRVVAQTHVRDKVGVSTVFIGIDHRFDDKGPPLLFETLIFGGKLDGDMWRYSSWDDAEVGHEAAVRKAKR